MTIEQGRLFGHRWYIVDAMGFYLDGISFATEAEAAATLAALEAAQ